MRDDRNRVPDDIISELIDVIGETNIQSTDDTDDWLLYIPAEYADAVRDHVDDRGPMDVYHNGTTIGGHDWTFDNYIDEPQLLPESVMDLTPETYCLLDPPYDLVDEYVERIGITERQYTNAHTGATIEQYKFRPFFAIEGRHHNLNQPRIDRYGLSVERLPDTDPEGFHRQLFGFEVSHHDRDEHIDIIEAQRERSHRTLVESLIEHANSVERAPIWGTRRRRITLPYEWLSFTHTEEIRCGTTHTHYGGLFLYPVDLTETTGHIDESIVGETGSIQEGHS